MNAEADNKKGRLRSEKVNSQYGTNANTEAKHMPDRIG